MEQTPVNIEVFSVGISAMPGQEFKITKPVQEEVLPEFTILGNISIWIPAVFQFLATLVPPFLPYVSLPLSPPRLQTMIFLD